MNNITGRISSFFVRRDQENFNYSTSQQHRCGSTINNQPIQRNYEIQTINSNSNTNSNSNQPNSDCQNGSNINLLSNLIPYDSLNPTANTAPERPPISHSINYVQSQNNNNNNNTFSSNRHNNPSSYSHLISLSLNSANNNNSSRVSNSSNSSRLNRRRNRSRNRSSHNQSRLMNSISNATSSTSSTSSSSSHLHAVNLNLFSFKKTERNLLSACCAVFCVAVLAVSLIETRWFYLSGGGCNFNYIGVAHFFAPGKLVIERELSKVGKTEITVNSFYLPNGVVLKNCANEEIILIMRAVIAFVFLAIFSSCVGLMLDTFGCMKTGFKLIRRHGIFHILTVVFCLAINGFCFWISERMNQQQIETRFKRGKKVDVSFDVSYYLIVLASGLSILATAFTLIRRYPTDEDEQLERLLEEYTGFEEPIHLERSLPAATVPLLQNLNQQSAPIENHILNSNDYHLNTQASNRLPSSRNAPTSYTFQQQAPPPPSTPPPPLHSNLNNSINNTNNSQTSQIVEPPPPYDPTPLIV